MGYGCIFFPQSLWDIYRNARLMRRAASAENQKHIAKTAGPDQQAPAVSPNAFVSVVEVIYVIR